MKEEEKNQPTMKPDEQMIIDESSANKDAPIEAAGKVSDTKAGGLAKLLFGKGETEEKAKDEKDSAESGEMRQAVDGDSQSGDEGEPVGVDDIKLDLAADEKAIVSEGQEAAAAQQNPEEKREETEEEKKEKVDFIQKVFIKPLLSRVFRFIDEK